MLKKFRNIFSRKKRGKPVKPRVLYILKNYPQLSQTYIKCEIEALLDNFEVEIVAISTPNYPDPEHQPFQHIEKINKIVEFGRKFKPSIVHSHHLVNAQVVAHVANEIGVPFTVRAHSFDAIKTTVDENTPSHINQLSNSINTDACLGMLAFPFTRDFLETEGNIQSGKIIDSPPVVDFHKFYNQEKNGNDVMNTGACRPKKNMEDFIRLASLVPHHTFNLYSIGHNTNLINELNKVEGNVVNMVEPVPFSAMPDVYKRHGWIVYTASRKFNNVGWPMALAEAQASGTVACMANIRPDIAEYLGDTGHIYDKIEDMVDILSSPPDPAKREAGFDNARKFDIRDNIHLLTDLWEPYLH